MVCIGFPLLPIPTGAMSTGHSEVIPTHLYRPSAFQGTPCKHIFCPPCSNYQIKFFSNFKMRQTYFFKASCIFFLYNCAVYIIRPCTDLSSFIFLFHINEHWLPVWIVEMKPPQAVCCSSTETCLCLLFPSRLTLLQFQHVGETF